MDREDSFDVLDLIVQPAFSVKDGKIIQVNQSATQRMILVGTEIMPMIATGSEEYAEFHEGCLYLTLDLFGQECGASVSKLNNTDIFVLENEADSAELRTMALIAKELRTPLSSIMTTADRLFPVLSDEKTGNSDQIAQMNKGLFQRETKIDISRYIEDGSNTIIFQPSVCPLKMYVELVEKYETKKEANVFLDNLEEGEFELEKSN